MYFSKKLPSFERGEYVLLDPIFHLPNTMQFLKVRWINLYVSHISYVRNITTNSNIIAFSFLLEPDLCS